MNPLETDGSISEVEREAAFRRAIEQAPEDPAPLALYAAWLASIDRMHHALACQQRACRLAPQRSDLLYTLGVLSEQCGYADEAMAAWTFAVRLAPAHFLARLRLGQALERRSLRHEATREYFRAITAAQMEGHWLDEASLPAAIAGAVLHAMDYVRTGRIEVLASLLTPLEHRFGARAMRRVRACLMGHLGVEALRPADPRQQPRFLYFPGLDDRPFLDPARFESVPRLEAATALLREEARRARQAPDAATPFLRFGPADRVDDYLGGDGAAPRWDAVFFYRHGQPCPRTAELCPGTAALLDSLPLVRIDGHAPEICFSILAPGTHIKPHHGVTNVRSVVHLPLVVPPDCALVVADEPHAWVEGQCVAFDDTFLHEAYNRSTQERIILLMDAWHPGLTAEERIAVAALIEGIGAFNRGG